MGRIGEKFESLRAKNEKALIVYLTAGDPSLDVTKKLILGLEESGSGYYGNRRPLFRSHSRRAGDSGRLTARTQNRDHSARRLDLVAEIRKTSQIPIVLFGYFNPIFAYGVENLLKRPQKPEWTAFWWLICPRKKHRN